MKKLASHTLYLILFVSVPMQLESANFFWAPKQHPGLTHIAQTRSFARACTILHWMIIAWPGIWRFGSFWIVMWVVKNMKKEASPDVQDFVRKMVPSLPTDVKIVCDDDEEYGATHNSILIPDKLEVLVKEEQFFIAVRERYEAIKLPSNDEWYSFLEMDQQKFILRKNKHIASLYHETGHVLHNDVMYQCLLDGSMPLILCGISNLVCPIEPFLGPIGKVVSALFIKGISDFLSIKYSQFKEQRADDYIINDEDILKAHLKYFKKYENNFNDAETYDEGRIPPQIMIPINKCTRYIFGIDLRDPKHPLDERRVARLEQRLENLKQNSQENHLKENRPVI